MNATETTTTTETAQERRNRLQRERRARNKANGGNGSNGANNAPAKPDGKADKAAEHKNGLDTRAMLVRMSIGYWGARQKDAETAQEVTTDNKAERDAGDWWTRMVPRASIRPVLIARSHCRDVYLRYTMPWGNDGSRVLPAAAYLEYSGKMRKAREEFDKAVAGFLAEYPELVRTAPDRLGDLAKGVTFPTAAQLQDAFPFSQHFYPLPTSGDFRVDLGNAETDEIKRDIEAQTKTAMETAMRDLWGRLYERLAKLVERLDDAEGVFRDSLVKNLAGLCELLPKMNVTGDAHLKELTDEVVAKLAKQEPEVLRKDKGKRADAAKAAKAILDKVAGFMGKKNENNAK